MDVQQNGSTVMYKQCKKLDASCLISLGLVQHKSVLLARIALVAPNIGGLAHRSSDGGHGERKRTSYDAESEAEEHG